MSNLANYKSFGFTKFIPRVTEEHFEAVVKHSANATEALVLWNDVSQALVPVFWLTFVIVPQLKHHIYALSPESSLFIGKRNLGQVSNYYLGEIVEDYEVTSIQAAAEKLSIDVLNTRLG